MRILALDPGATTGVALFADDTIKTDQLGYHHSLVYRELVHADPTHVVFERFVYQRRDKVDLRPVEMIGIIKFFCQQRDIHPQPQTPSQAKKFWDDKKITYLGLWETSSPHAMDALRHLLYYMTFTLGDQRWMEQLR